MHLNSSKDAGWAHIVYVLHVTHPHGGPLQIAVMFGWWECVCFLDQAIRCGSALMQVDSTESTELQ